MLEESSQKELAVAEETKELKDLKALFYRFNAKPDTTTKIYTDKVKVDLDRIQDLNERIIEKLQLHYVEAGFISSIIISFSDRKTISFDCWETFCQHKWNEASSVKSIVMIWDFSVKLLGYENPQRHKLTVKLSAGLRPEELLNLIMTGKIDNLDELDSDQFPIIAQMDFIDTQLCDEFINIVTEWVNSLEKTSHKKNKIMLFFRKHRKFVAEYVNYFFVVMFAICGIIGINYIMGTYNIQSITDVTYMQFRFVFNYIIIFGILLFVIYKICDYIAKRLFETLVTYNNGYIFNLTWGDKNKQNELENQDKKTTVRVLLEVVLSVLFNVGCGILSSVLFSLIG
mgnify:CR=1 FL=1